MGYLIPDDPIIRCMERTGMPPWEQEDSQYFCPVCGAECETVYIDEDDQVVGCDCCIRAKDVYDMGN